MFFEVIGVEIDEAGQQEIAVHVLRAGQPGGAHRNLDDLAVAQTEITLNDLVFQHDARVA